MQPSIEDNPLVFWAGLVLVFLGLAGALFYLLVRTSNESLIMPGPVFRLKHFILCLVVIAAGAVLASFSRPRGSSVGSEPR
jgi:hypothetical protein